MKGWTSIICDCESKFIHFYFVFRVSHNQEIRNKIISKQNDNQNLDKRIQNLNVRVAEQQMARDTSLEERDARETKERLQALAERARLVRQVQQQHAQIIELSTLLELQRLKTFPTLCVAAPGSFKK